MPDQRKRIGEMGEEAARNYLENIGYKILTSNLENSKGEVDVVAFDPEHNMFVFVEVRTRTTKTFHGETSIDGRKRDKIRKAARTFLAERNALEVSHRFDVVGITMDLESSSSKPDIRHHRAAFS